jgi:hypothetical protein
MKINCFWPARHSAVQWEEEQVCSLKNACGVYKFLEGHLEATLAPWLYIFCGKNTNQQNPLFCG